MAWPGILAALGGTSAATVGGTTAAALGGTTAAATTAPVVKGAMSQNVGGLAGLFGGGGGGGMSRDIGGIDQAVKQSQQRLTNMRPMPSMVPPTQDNSIANWSQKLSQMLGGGGDEQGSMTPAQDAEDSWRQKAGALEGVTQAIGSAFGGPMSVKPLPSPYSGPQVGPNVDPGQEGLMKLMMRIAGGQ